MPTVDAIVLGIDPGTNVTGFGAVSKAGSRLIHIESGIIPSNPRDPLELRLKTIHRALQHVMERCRPTAVAIESIFYSKNVRSAIVLAHARGVALLAAAELSLPVAEYSPMEVKMATVGYGRASKGQVTTMVQHLLRIPKGERGQLSDQTDALAVALCHLNTHQFTLRTESARTMTR